MLFIPFRGILLQTVDDHLAKCFSVGFVLILVISGSVQGRRIVLKSEHEYLHRWIFVIRRGTARHFDRCDTQRPYVSLEVVSMILHVRTVGL